MSTPQLVTDLYRRYQARDWSAAATLLHPDAELDMPATAERLVGRAQVIGLQERYPEPWGDLSVLRAVGSADAAEAAVELEVVAPVDVFRCAAFWQVADGLLRRGVEYWVTVAGERPPPR